MKKIILFICLLFTVICFNSCTMAKPNATEEGVEITDTLNGNYVKPSVIVHNGHRYLIFFYNSTVIHEPECEKKDMLWVLQHQHSHLNTD